VEAYNEFLTMIIETLGARSGFTMESDNGSSITSYVVNGKVFLVHKFNGDNGFEVYLPADETNDINATVDALKAYLYK